MGGRGPSEIRQDLQYDPGECCWRQGSSRLLILLTALFVAAEFAAVGRAPEPVATACRGRQALWPPGSCPVVEDAHALDRYIAASQIGITLSSLILGAYAQASIAPRVAPLVAASSAGSTPTPRSIPRRVVVLLVLTLLAMIAGELIPKSLALQDPTRTAMWTVVPMQWSRARVRLVDRLPQRQRQPDPAS